MSVPKKRKSRIAQKWLPKWIYVHENISRNPVQHDTLIIRKTSLNAVQVSREPVESVINKCYLCSNFAKKKRRKKGIKYEKHQMH